MDATHAERSLLGAPSKMDAVRAHTARHFCVLAADSRVCRRTLPPLSSTTVGCGASGHPHPSDATAWSAL
eukprot:4909108-Prymnesium_polylepis.1